MISSLLLHKNWPTQIWIVTTLAVALLALRLVSAMSPLGALRSNPIEHTLPMPQIAQDILEAANLQLTEIRAKAQEDKKRSAGKKELVERDFPRAYAVSFRQKPVLPAQISIANTKNFLLLRDSQVTCDGRTLLKVLDEPLADFESAAIECLKDKYCDFFTWRPNGHNFPSVAWLCQSDGWRSPSPVLNWIVAVRPSVLAIHGFDININAAAPCDKSFRLLLLHGPQSINDISRKCLSMEACTYFSINYGGSHSEYLLAKKDYGQVTYLCMGKPRHSTMRHGWVIGTKYQADKEPLLGQKFPTALLKPKSYIIPSYQEMNVTAYNGPVTNDDYFDQAKRGEIVPRIPGIID